MSKVAIEKIHEPAAGATSLFEEMERVAQEVRRRAFDHFLGHGASLGRDLDDWLRAERELIWTPGAEMTETDKAATLRVQAPGLEPNKGILQIVAGKARTVPKGRTVRGVTHANAAA